MWVASLFGRQKVNRELTIPRRPACSTSLLPLNPGDIFASMNQGGMAPVMVPR